jgi:hypothetical protein
MYRRLTRPASIVSCALALVSALATNSSACSTCGGHSSYYGGYGSYYGGGYSSYYSPYSSYYGPSYYPTYRAAYYPISVYRPIYHGSYYGGCPTCPTCPTQCLSPCQNCCNPCANQCSSCSTCPTTGCQDGCQTFAPTTYYSPGGCATGQCGITSRTSPSRGQFVQRPSAPLAQSRPAATRVVKAPAPKAAPTRIVQQSPTRTASVPVRTATVSKAKTVNSGWTAVPGTKLANSR